MPELDFVHGGVKLKRVKELLADATEIVIVAGYASAAGFKKIQSSLKNCLDAGGAVLLLLGLDRGGVASPELVRVLGKMLAKYEGLRVRFVIESGNSFLHAKIYAARKKGGTAHLIVGSFNLTSKGFGLNKEFALDVSGRAKEVFDELEDFVNGMDARILDENNWEACAQALEPVVLELEPEEEEAREKASVQRREESKKRLERLTKILPEDTQALLKGGAEICLDELLGAGSFYSVKFDLKKTAVPAGLKFLFKNNILSKEKVSDAGTAKYREIAGSASWPLLPAALHKRYTDCGKNLSRSLSDVGFDTPYGFWVPDSFRHRLQRRVQAIAAELPQVSRAEELIEAQIEVHRKEVSESSAFIVARATRDGINPPTLWKKVEDKAFAAVSTKYAEQTTKDVRSWNPDDDLYREAVVAIEQHVARTIDQLNSKKAIQKIRRLRPELHRVPVVASETVARDLLESMVWAVLEALTSKRKRAVVKPLYWIARNEEEWIPLEAGQTGMSVHESPAVMEKKSEDLGLLSEALLEGEDFEEHQAKFFAIFGAPPYWKPMFGDDYQSADDDGDDDEDDDDEDEDDEVSQ